MKATIQIARVIYVAAAGNFDRVTSLVVATTKDSPDYLEKMVLIAPRGMFSLGQVDDAVTVEIRLRRATSKYSASLSVWAISRNARTA